MDTPPQDNTQKLIELFARTVEIREPDFTSVLSKPVPDLEAGKSQANTLVSGVVQPQDPIDPQAVGRLRFPELPGVAALFAEGLAKHPELIAEVWAPPELFTHVIALDEAVERLIYVGQLFTSGGDTGEVLAGTAAQKACQDSIDQKDARLAQLQQGDAEWSDLTTSFAPVTGAVQDLPQRQHQAKLVSAHGEKTYHDKMAQAQKDTELSNAIDSYMSDTRGEQNP